MTVDVNASGQERPESLIARLAARLRHQVLWDSCLLVFPPAVALIYIGVIVYRTNLIGPVGLGSIVVAVAGLGLCGIFFRAQPLAPSLIDAAALADSQAQSQDRFLTLATVQSCRDAEPLLARLAQETTGYGSRIEPKRDFPYKIKRSFYQSLLVSIVIALVFPVLIPVAQSVIAPLSVQQKVRAVADKMAQKESLKQIAAELKSLAAKLEDPKVPAEEKQAAKEEMEKQIEEQQKKEPEKENRDLLSQAAESLKGTEEQPSPAGQEQKKEQDKGGGGIQSNTPQDGKGEGKQSQGGGADGKGESGEQMSKNDMQQGKPGQGNPKEPGNDQQSQGEGKGEQRDPNQPGKEPNQEKIGKNQSGKKDGARKNQASDEPPQGAPPAERFYKAGEGKEGIKGARYVTVQLPEEIAADAKSGSKSTKEGSGSRTRSQLPASNAPLPAHVPNAPMEKQQMPLEYRGIIR